MVTFTWSRIIENKGDLAKYLETVVMLPKHKIWKFLIEITLALAYLHKSGVTHGDIKPQNIFISGEDVVKVGDFSSAVTRTSKNHHSLNGGTPCYMAPEIYNKESYCSKVDIWSLGGIIYELGTNRRAFDSSHYETLKHKIIDGKAPLITFPQRKVKNTLLLNNTPVKTRIRIDLKLNDGEEDLQNIYLWGVQKDPDNRPSAEDILSLPSVRKKARFFKINIPPSYIKKKL